MPGTGRSSLLYRRTPANTSTNPAAARRVNPPRCPTEGWGLPKHIPTPAPHRRCGEEHPDGVRCGAGVQGRERSPAGSTGAPRCSPRDSLRADSRCPAMLRDQGGVGKGPCVSLDEPAALLTSLSGSPAGTPWRGTGSVMMKPWFLRRIRICGGWGRTEGQSFLIQAHRQCQSPLRPRLRFFQPDPLPCPKAPARRGAIHESGLHCGYSEWVSRR